jgi:hypothetical protein
MKHSPSRTRVSRAFIRTLGLAAVVALALSASGCDKEVQRLESKNEGTRVALDNLFYQIQISRMLNPKDVEDSYYLRGQPTPAKGDSYFGVFVYVVNETKEQRILPAPESGMKIVTASGDEYKPLPLRAPGWGYEPSPLGKGAVLPIPNTPAYVGPIRGALVLFRIPQKSLDSRPLEFEIKGRGGKTATTTLDV